MSIDLHAFLQALEANPEQLAALRRVVLGEHADVNAALVSLAQAQERTGVRLEALAVRIDELARAQARTEARLDELSKDVRALAVAQRRTEDSLKSLVDVVGGVLDRLGKLDGDALERRYRERGHLQPIARRLAPGS